MSGVTIPIDPLAGLKAEIAAEDAAKVDDKAVVVAGDDDEAEVKDEAKEPEKVKEEEPKPRTKVSPAMVPIGRVNEETAKRRRAEREIEGLKERIAALEADPESAKKPVSEDDRKKMQAEARAQARLEMTVESFLNAGNEAYGEDEFNALSSTLSDLGAPDTLVLIAIEATGSAALAAKAIFNLGQKDAAEIEKIFKMSPIRLGAQLAALTGPRRAPKKEEEDEEPVRANGKDIPVSKAPKPIQPVQGSAKAKDDEIDDTLSEDEFTERFDKLMDRRRARHN